MKEATKKPNITLFFPVYKDENTVERVVSKSFKVLKEIAGDYEVIVINDGSPDKSGAVADSLKKKYKNLTVIHHKVNMGYGAALKSGFEAAKYEWICFTDGDDEYDVNDLRHLIKLKDYYDLIITFRYKKLYSNFRILTSLVYNKVVRLIFRSSYRDISTGLRLVKKEVVDQLNLTSNSPFIGAELTLRIMLKGYRVGEVGIQTFPREFGSGSTVSLKNIWLTIKDLRSVYKSIFS